MMWQTLWNKIGKQPARVMQNENVVVILERHELIKLLNDKKSTYMIPLSLKFGTGRRRMWFIKSPDRKERDNH